MVRCLSRHLTIYGERMKPKTIVILIVAALRLDMISIGPTLEDVHSPADTKIAAVQKVMELLKTPRRIPET